MRILLISGSLREGSTNTAALMTAQRLVPSGMEPTLYRGMGSLPHFNPDEDREGEQVDAAVADLREHVAWADALVLCTPEYAGALSGALKNLLEWTVGDGCIYRKPIAWINVSGPSAPTGGADAHDSLRKVLGYVHADVVERACREYRSLETPWGQTDCSVTRRRARRSRRCCRFSKMSSSTGKPVPDGFQGASGWPPRRHSRRDCRSPSDPEAAGVASPPAARQKQGANPLTASSLLVARSASILRWAPARAT